MRDREGREVTSTAQIIAAPDLDCPAESRITLPNGRTTKAKHLRRLRRGSGLRAGPAGAP
ncbi:hypothetical protein AB0945_08850 [Streptomyces sp. NPDC005474]|uniref:hypothetical protein n=1 Tax=Streptomyces sp. NPDC005474 TaxID=3154878 RepID=UPI00345531D6